MQLTVKRLEFVLQQPYCMQEAWSRLCCCLSSVLSGAWDAAGSSRSPGALSCVLELCLEAGGWRCTRFGPLWSGDPHLGLLFGSSQYGGNNFVLGAGCTAESLWCCAEYLPLAGG